MKVVWSPLAIEKLEAIAKFIALDKHMAAEKRVNDIFDRADLLGSQPESRRQVPEMLDTSYREVIFGNYRIIYKVGNEVKVLTIRNCRQLLSISDLEL